MKVNIGWWRECWVGVGSFAPMRGSPIPHTAFIEWVFLWTIGPLGQSELTGRGGGQSIPYAGTSNKSTRGREMVVVVQFRNLKTSNSPYGFLAISGPARNARTH